MAHKITVFKATQLVTGDNFPCTIFWVADVLTIGRHKRDQEPDSMILDAAQHHTFHVRLQEGGSNDMNSKSIVRRRLLSDGYQRQV